MTEKWLRVTTEENAIDFLEKAAEFVDRADDYRWKWVSLCLHSALYAFAICALYGTNPDVVVARGKRRKRMRRLIEFREALNRCQQKEHMQWWVQSKTLKLSDDEDWAIKKISQTLRNNFEHYLPKSWSIEVSGMPLIVRHCSRVIRFLASGSGNFRIARATDQQRIRKALDVLEEAAR